MEILNDLKQQKTDNLSLILGFFDGLHTGHREVIRTGVQFAKNNGFKSALITFRDAPAVILKNKPAQYILTTREKIQKIEELGVDYLYIINFDETLARMTASDYLKMLVENFKPKAITTGDNHFFGNNRTGSADYIDLMKNEYGYEYFRVNSIKFEDKIVSSTSIRNALIEGDINTANLLLGYRFYIKGDVVQGRHLGRTIGFKTANINYPENIVKIPDGVYAVEVEINNEKYMGIANYGSNPTVTKDAKKLTEVHLVNFDKNIYGETIKIDFLKKIRDEQQFKSLTDLKEQITKDIKCLKL